MKKKYIPASSNPLFIVRFNIYKVGIQRKPTKLPKRNKNRFLHISVLMGMLLIDGQMV